MKYKKRENRYTENDKEVCEELNKRFQKAFTIAQEEAPALNEEEAYQATLEEFDLTNEGTIDSKTHENYYITDKHALAAMKLKLELAKIEREQQEALQIREREAALRKEEQECEVALKERAAALKEREATLLREREREHLEARKRDLEIQREHSKQLANSALEYRRQELALETTHHTHRKQATASLPIPQSSSSKEHYGCYFGETTIEDLHPVWISKRGSK
ncbi:uncharacterized protein [Procambarus clarkii]|uniref:uncharacterized protein n=1 Tax=Procambarus clarkii TaxID=6728 RepID=UPI0037425424